MAVAHSILEPRGGAQGPGYSVLLCPELGHLLYHTRSYGRTRLVLVGMLGLADRHREVWATYKEIGLLAGVTEDSVRHHLSYLMVAGEVERIAGHRGRLPPRYRILVGAA